MAGDHYPLQRFFRGEGSQLSGAGTCSGYTSYVNDLFIRYVVVVVVAVVVV